MNYDLLGRPSVMVRRLWQGTCQKRSSGPRQAVHDYGSLKVWLNPERTFRSARKWSAACPWCDSLLGSFPSSRLFDRRWAWTFRVIIQSPGVQTFCTDVKWTACTCRMKAPSQEWPKKVSPPSFAGMVFWGNLHGNIWTFQMLWKVKDQIHTTRRDNQLFQEKTAANINYPLKSFNFICYIGHHGKNPTVPILRLNL